MRIQKQFKIASIVVIALGIIHVAATPFIFPLFKANIQLDLASLFVYEMTGLSTLFLGWLQKFIIKRVNDNDGFEKILRVSVLFLSLMGIGAVATMWNNPFAYISLIIAFYEFLLLRKLGTIEKSE